LRIHGAEGGKWEAYGGNGSGGGYGCYGDDGYGSDQD